MGDAAPDGAEAAPRAAAKQFGAPATMLPGGVSRFAGRGGRKKGGSVAPRGSWRPAASGSGLPAGGTDLTNGRPCRPRTIGKLGRSFGTAEAEIGHRESLSEFVAFYSGRGLRCSPDAASLETPPGAFSAGKAAGAIKKNNPRRTEEAASEQAT